ncbi:hypothetical protein CHLNCDRAFT_142419 [Chlorella variabilis]|uniref:ABC transporter domain-containing protein n=1 Tax=Chlorella variabilis TaxID=554065 RepID=E1Z731_CHLVA|nr:hypothetical protein CHLNCDRAFT_142419 [Chlorella variabilis]EFN58353.1 hypothetical protein CHLNCDRAFT_142419 [Chlorella variabilis]|eukprot:XP_005850455.1 hypothetical protein CHLNCDRAFT_142419 [Chlorella variabilis]
MTAPSGVGVGPLLALLTPKNKRRALGVLALAAAASYGASQYAAQQRRRQRRQQEKRRGGAPDGAGRSRRGSGGGGKALKELLPLLLRVAGRKVLVIALLAVARTALSNRLARLQGYLFRAAFLRRVPLFMRNLAENLALCGVAAALEATNRSWVSHMELQWRRLLTDRLHGTYFADMTYYKLSYVDRRIDTPEQRMCEDVPKLAAGLSDLTRELVAATVDAAFYAYQLRQYSGTHRYTAAILAYVFGVGSFMAVVSPNFGGLFKRQQALEGTHRALQRDLSLRVPAGTNLLVTGPNGAGKSSLFRVLGGLWSLSHGRIYKPGGGGEGAGGLSETIFYVPQRPYVTQGSLQEQLIYPLPATAERRIPEEPLRGLLATVDLQYLLDRAAEQAVPAGCVTVDMEERFCELVKQLGCTCITISHRPALMAFHDIVLSLDGEGGWSLHQGHRSLEAKAEAAARQAGGGASEIDAGFTVPPPPRPASAGGNGKGKGKGKGKARGTDAAAVLSGMAVGKAEEEEMLGDGNEGFSVDIEEALYRHAAALGITFVTITQARAGRAGSGVARTALVKYHDRELRLTDGEGEAPVINHECALKCIKKDGWNQMCVDDGRADMRGTIYPNDCAWQKCVATTADRESTPRYHLAPLECFSPTTCVLRYKNIVRCKQCGRCDNGFYRKRGACKPCPANCKKCSIRDPKYCGICNEGFAWFPRNGTCMRR